MGIFLFGMGFGNSEATTTDVTPCGNCHDFSAKPYTNPSYFEITVINDGSPDGTIVNKTTCKTCHLSNWSYHQGAHLQRVEVSTGVYAAFKKKDSIYRPAQEVHNLHNGRQRIGIFIGCLRCHGTVSCKSCHNNIPHEKHIGENPVNPLTKQPIVIPDLQVVVGVNNPYAGYSPYWTVPTSCAARECHQTIFGVLRTRVDGSDLCFNCHQTGSSGHGDVSAKHKPSGLDPQCQSCHKASIIEEHLFNQVTQKRDLTCSICHNSLDPRVKRSIGNENTDCSSCHLKWHGLGFAAKVPPDIPLMDGLVWSPPQEASIWAGESWLPEEFSNGQVVISGRTKSITGDGVFNYYKSALLSEGWIQTQTETTVGSDLFRVEFVKGERKLLILFYAGENHTAAPAVNSGYRVELIYTN